MKVKIGKKEYALEVNMNVIESFEEETGKDILEIMTSGASGEGDEESRGLSMFKKLGTKSVSQFVYACLKEGERLEGREIDISRQDVNANLNFSDMMGYFALLGKALSGGETPEEHVLDETPQKKIVKRPVKK